MAYNSFSNGLSPDSYYFGNIIANYVITLVNLCVAINMSSINWISAVTLIFEMLSFNIFFPIYVALPVRKTYREYLKLMIFDIKFWLLYVIVIVFALFPRIIIKYYKSNYMPEDSDIYREIEKYHLEDHEGYNDLEKGDKIRYSVTEKLSQLDQHKVPQVPLSTSISPTGTGLPIIKEEEENVESGTGIGTGTGTETEAGKENKVSFYPSKYPESEIDESVVSGGYDESIYNEASVLFKRQSYTPSENGNLSLDRKHKAMSIRSSRSRRNNILKQGTSADGNAMSVIFMDNNEEYVNTGFAFAYNDEEELFNRSRSKNPLYKAKSVDDIYEDKRRKRHKNRRENFSYAGRRQSQPEFIFKPFTKLNEN
jgi:phospholipid-translocating ATPase